MLLLAFGLRMLTLGNQSLWYDEAFSLLLAQYDLAEIAERTARDTMPPLYYWLLHLWGDDPHVDSYPRYLSVIAGTLSVALVFTITRRLFSTPASLWASLFTAIAPFQVFYGQEARMYALLGLWNLLAAYGFLLGWQEGRKTGWALYGVGTALALYTHGLGGLPSAALLGWAVAAAWVGRSNGMPWWRPLRGPLAALALAGGLYLPWLSVLPRQAQSVLDSFWVAPPSLLSPLASLYLFYEGPFGRAAFPLLLAIVLLPLALTLPTVWRTGPDRNALGFLWAWLALPLLALLALSVARPLYLERVVIGASFPLYILLGWIAAHLRPRPLGVALGVAVLAAGCFGLAGWFGDPYLGRPPQRAAAAVAALWRPGQPVLHTVDSSYLPFLLYAPHIENRLLAGDPEAVARTARGRSTHDALGIQAVPLEEAVQGAREFTVVIVLDHSVEYQQELAATLDMRYVRLDEQNIGGILVRRYRQP